MALVESLSRTTGRTDTVLPERLANTRAGGGPRGDRPASSSKTARARSKSCHASASSARWARRRSTARSRSPTRGGSASGAGPINCARAACVSRRRTASRPRWTSRARRGWATTTSRFASTARPGASRPPTRSSPPLGERDLQSLIVTGRVDTPGRATNQDDFAVTAATGDILGFAGRFVGLDSVAIGSADLDLATKDVSTDQHLTVSKSFGNRFEVILSDNLETSAFTWLMTWRPGAGWEVRLASVENTDDSLEVRRILVFRAGRGDTPRGRCRRRLDRRAAPRRQRGDRRHARLSRGRIATRAAPEAWRSIRRPAVDRRQAPAARVLPGARVPSRSHRADADGAGEGTDHRSATRSIGVRRRSSRPGDELPSDAV